VPIVNKTRDRVGRESKPSMVQCWSPDENRLSTGGHQDKSTLQQCLGQLTYPTWRPHVLRCCDASTSRYTLQY